MKLVLFDIDGTLLHAGGAGLKATLDSLRDFYGVPQAPPDYSMAGKIDTQIVFELLDHAGIEPTGARARLNDYWQAYIEALEREIPVHAVTALPGVLPLLAHLREHPEALLGLLTGNLGPAAHIKLRAAGIDPAQFVVAAYGHEAESRADLPALAVARAEAMTGQRFAGKDVVIIGDTPMDVQCGESLGVRTVGVATGRYSVADLQAVGADVVFPDFSDTPAVLEAILDD